jgi:hypothetical protein
VLQKPESFSAKASRVKLQSSYRNPLITQALGDSGFPMGKKDGSQIDPILEFTSC